jgi:hypothetical protein
MTVVKLTAASLWKWQAATFTLRLRMRPATNRELSCVKFRQSRSGVMFAKLFWLDADSIPLAHSLGKKTHAQRSLLNVGARGFERPTCRRGDRSTVIYRAGPCLVPSCNIVRVGLLQRG